MNEKEMGWITIRIHRSTFKWVHRLKGLITHELGEKITPCQAISLSIAHNSWLIERNLKNTELGFVDFIKEVETKFDLNTNTIELLEKLKNHGIDLDKEEN